MSRWLASAVALVTLCAVAHAQPEPCEGCDDQPPAPPPELCAGCIVQVAPPAPPPRSTSEVSLRYDIGPVYTYALSRSFVGARTDVALGRDFASGLVIDGRFGGEAGRSQSGLPYQRVSWGAGIGGRLTPRVRLSIDPRLGVLLIERATHPAPDQGMFTFTFGVHGELVLALLGPGPRFSRVRSGGIDLIAHIGYDAMPLDGPHDPIAHTVSVKLGLGGHF